MTDSSHASTDRTAIADFPDQDQENFRLIRSFNDIFVALASLLVFGSAFVLLGSVSDESNMWREIASNISLIFFVIALSAWVLAEIFTRKRSMALPSILYATVFTSAIGLSTFVGTLDNWQQDSGDQLLSAMKANRRIFRRMETTNSRVSGFAGDLLGLDGWIAVRFARVRVILVAFSSGYLCNVDRVERFFLCHGDDGMDLR